MGDERARVSRTELSGLDIKNEMDWGFLAAPLTDIQRRRRRRRKVRGGRNDSGRPKKIVWEIGREVE